MVLVSFRFVGKSPVRAVGFIESDHFHFTHGMVGPESQRKRTDDLGLDWTSILGVLLVIAFLERIVGEAFQKRENPLAIPSRGCGEQKRFVGDEDFVRRHPSYSFQCSRSWSTETQ